MAHRISGLFGRCGERGKESVVVGGVRIRLRIECVNACRAVFTEIEIIGGNIRFGRFGRLDTLGDDVQFDSNAVIDDHIEGGNAFRPAGERACCGFCLLGIVKHVFGVAHLFKIAGLEQVERVVVFFKQVVGRQLHDSVL